MSLCFIAHIYSLTFIINSIAPLTHHQSSEAVFVSILWVTWKNCWFSSSLFVFSASSFVFPVTNLSDYEGDLSYMDDDIDELTYTNSNQLHNNKMSITGTSITSISDDRRSISTLNQQCFDEIFLEDSEMNLDDFCEWAEQDQSWLLLLLRGFLFCFIYLFFLLYLNIWRAHLGLKLFLNFSHVVFLYGYQSRQFPRCSHVQLYRQTTDHRIQQQTFCNVLWIMHESFPPLFFWEFFHIIVNHMSHISCL